MKPLKLKTGAGDTFQEVAKKAVEVAQNTELVQFEFNGVNCLVHKTTNPELLFRDYCNAWTMEWKEVGPNCVENYDPETQKELDKRKADAERKRDKAAKKQAEEDAAAKTEVDEKIKNVKLLIWPEKLEEYQKYVETNSGDGYSRGVVDYAEQWAKLMQIAIADGKTNIRDIAEETQKPLSYLGITGFMYGCVIQALSHFWLFGEELRIWHNKEYGVSEDKKGVVNPAILTINT
jgi:hypothetical protein